MPIDDDPDRDLLPERHRGGRRTRRGRAGPSEYAPRFQFMTGALSPSASPRSSASRSPSSASRPAATSGPAWSSWKPTSGGLQGATEIASHIAGAYRDQGKQLVKVDANDISYKGIPLLVAMRKSAEEGGAIQVHDEKGVLYQMCGLGVNCQIDSGKPSKERMLLLRREGLELALYTSATSRTSSRSSCSSRPTPGKAQTIALYFSRDALRPELDRPLTSSLLPTRADDEDRHPLARRAAGRPDTNPTSSRSWARASTTAATSCSTPTAPSADRALQKRLKEQQKQAAAAAAQAAAGSTPQASGG